MSRSTPNPWERLPDESEAAFAAFMAFRDLGPSRTMIEAYDSRPGGKGTSKARKRHAKGTPKAPRQLPGTWKAWSKSFRWADRAVAFDAHQDRTRQKGIDKASEQVGADWVRRRLDRAERDHRIADKIAAKVELLAEFPVTRRTSPPDANGMVTVVEPISVRDLHQVASIARMSQEIAQAAIREALPDEEDFDPLKATLPELKAYLERKARAR